ncbi:MAG: ABC transporter permease [Chloroflexi bacterium]|nr:ABC transporter permease [Chloroflexota bacterium]MBV9600834.1 ABC transporter permease [Chloroflexota bacterium]
MGRAAYIRRRLVLTVFVLFGVTVIIFGMVHFLPGDPATTLLGDRATQQNIADLREQLGLNRPLPEQYWLFVSGLVEGQMGTSMQYHQPVRDMVAARVPITIGLSLYAMLLAAILTFTFGLLAAVRKGGVTDQAIRVAFLLALTTPSFWLGILLILVLALRLHWFPVAGFGTTFTDHIWYLFLPALTLGLGLAAVLIRNLRSSVITTTRSDYVRTARAKGLLERMVLLRHILRNAVLSTVTIFGLQFGFLIGGALVVETVFAIPGLGQLLFTSITSRDYPVVQAITVVTALMVILVNLLVDLSYSFLDPRVTYG